MADHEESYFLKYLFLIFVGFFASRHFSFNPPFPRGRQDKRPTDKRLMDKHAADKRRPGSAIRNGRLLPANIYPAGHR